MRISWGEPSNLKLRDFENGDVMRFIKDKRLVFSGSEVIKILIEDLSLSKELISVTAKELPAGTQAKVVSVSGQTFTVETTLPIRDDLYVPLSSWKFSVNLTGCHLSFATMLLSRDQSDRVQLSMPEMLISGEGRQTYRIQLKEESIGIGFECGMDYLECLLSDASFGGAKLIPQSRMPLTIEAGKSAKISGVHKGIRFCHEGVVGWIRNESIGLTLDKVTSADHPWNAFIRSLAYDQILDAMQNVA